MLILVGKANFALINIPYRAASIGVKIELARDLKVSKLSIWPKNSGTKVPVVSAERNNKVESNLISTCHLGDKDEVQCLWHNAGEGC